MPHQELSSAKYFTENPAPEAENAPAELLVEASQPTRAADVIKVINMLILFTVIAGFSGGAYWLYHHKDAVPRMNKNDSKDLRMSFLSWFVGSDVTEPSHGFGGGTFDQEDFMEQLERQNEEMMERFEEQQAQIMQSIGRQQQPVYEPFE
jgi:hypothetical protein